MEQLPKIVRERLQNRVKPEVHPDPDLLTAFAENSLPERDRVPVLEHLSSCAGCREVVMLAQPESAIAHVAAAATSSAPSRPRWSGRLIFGWAAVAACVVIGVALLRYQTRESNLAQVASRQAAPAMNAGQSPNAAQSSAKTQPPAAAPQNELAAQLEPPVSLESKPRARADKDFAPTVTGRLRARPLAKKLGGLGAEPGQTAGALAPAPQLPQMTEQVTVSGEAPQITSDQTASIDKEQAEIPLQARSSVDLPLRTQDSSAKVANQALAVAAAPPAAQPNNPAAPPPSPTAAAAHAGTDLGSVAAFSRQESSLEKTQAVTNQKLALARVASNYVPSRWTISSDGTTLLRSTDGGRSWDAVSVAKNVAFRVVASLGPEVWVGGKAGALYHSSDLGAHWTQVKPEANGVALTADIVSLDFPDPEHGKLTTSEGKVWITNDGGKSWQTP